MKSSSMRLLSFNAGFVDTVGFLALQGLFAAHVTGNFVTLAADFLYGSSGSIGKILALPEFVLVVALARLAGATLTARGRETLTILLGVETVLLTAFFGFGVAYGPFTNGDAIPALAASFSAVAAMALQNAVQRVHFPGEPPTAIMTNNVTQAVLDGIDLLRGSAPSEVRDRFLRITRNIAWFAFGCGTGAALYHYFAFWSLLTPVVITAALIATRINEKKAPAKPDAPSA